MRRVVISSVTVVVTLLQANELSAQQVSAIPSERPADHSAGSCRSTARLRRRKDFGAFAKKTPKIAAQARTPKLD